MWSQNEAFLLISLMVVTMSLPSIIMVHLRNYNRLSVAKVLGCCAKNIISFHYNVSLILPTVFVTHHSTKTVRFNIGHPPYSHDL